MNNKRKRSQDNKKRSNKIIRCSGKMIPVFESDTCEDFIKRINSEPNNICKNCEKSF